MLIWLFVLIFSTMIGYLITSWVLLFVIDPSLIEYKTYNKQKLILSLGFGTIGLILFFVGDYLKARNYWYTHSLWHVFGTIAITTMLDVYDHGPGIEIVFFMRNRS